MESRRNMPKDTRPAPRPLPTERRSTNHSERRKPNIRYFTPQKQKGGGRGGADGAPAAAAAVAAAARFALAEASAVSGRVRREASPCIDAALQKIVRLSGGLCP